MPEQREEHDPAAGAAMPHPVRLKDVAEAANVALSTASRALRGQSRINVETRRRVWEAARRLGYDVGRCAAPDGGGQADADGGNETGRRAVGPSRDTRVGVVCLDLAGTFSPTILLGAENAFQARSTAMLLINAGGNEALLHRCVEQLLAQDVAGLLVISRRTDPVEHLDVPVPCVYAYGRSVDPDDCSIVQDNVAAGHMAVDHLLSCGYRRIAIIGGDKAYEASRERMEGALDALRAHGLEPVGTPRFGPWDTEWGRAATRLLLNDDPTFDAVVCQSDVLARGCIDELERSGRRVPQNTAVIGHDDKVDFVIYAHPHLTSINDHNEEVGRRAAVCLMDAIDGRPHHGVEYVAASLVQRESTLPSD